MAKRILVAEDDPDNRCIVVKVLTLKRYETSRWTTAGPPWRSRAGSVPT
jgi:CheY-like chemotaxis protein